jgi:hypothetical protein
MVDEQHASMQIFTRDAATGSSRVVAEVTLSRDLQMTIVTAEPGQEARLQRICEEMNLKRLLTVEVPSPADAPRYATSTRSIPRTHPDFLPAMTLYLRKFYDLFLGRAALDHDDDPFPLAMDSQAGNPFG